MYCLTLALIVQVAEDKRQAQVVTAYLDCRALVFHVASALRPGVPRLMYTAVPQWTRADRNLMALTRGVWLFFVVADGNI